MDGISENRLDPTPPHRPRILHYATVPDVCRPPRSVQRELRAAIIDPFGGRFTTPSSSTGPEPRYHYSVRRSTSSIILVRNTFCIHSIVCYHRVRDVILHANRDPAGNRNPPPLLHPLGCSCTGLMACRRRAVVNIELLVIVPIIVV
jgi:hypothetical protein